MHIYFSGIHGAALGPLAILAHQAGYHVSGSDKQHSQYTDYLKAHGIADIHVGQTSEAIAAVHARQPIDWLVYSSAVAIEQPDHPELAFCRQHGIKTSKRDELINQIMSDKQLSMLAVAGTHGKTTTTAMLIWLWQQLGLPLSYSVGAKLSFGDMGHYQPDSQFFAYECDEYDRNFLAFSPTISLIAGIDWDHADIYPTRQAYYDAFKQFIGQSQHSFIWQADAERLKIHDSSDITILDEADIAIERITLPGRVNRMDAYIVAQAVAELTDATLDELLALMSNFPGLSRRFEKLAPNIYTDYAHTPRKIEGALQIAHEVAGDNVVVVYEGLHNTRQHFIKDDLAHLFDSVKQLYVVPSYLAREDTSLALLSPSDIIQLTSQPQKGVASNLNDSLWSAIQQHAAAGDTVLCLTAGGGNSLDEWLRQRLSTHA